MSNSSKTTKRRYITGFDGLRTLGVIGVILYHLRPELFRGGYLGVPIFMVVSGYLITDGLVMQYDRTHTIDFKTFFIKRIKRLYPGLIAVLFGTSAYIALFAHNLLHNLHLMVATNLVYVYNWWQIANGQSYFARYANGESPFTHLWTLSIEGQYYLIWAFLVFAGLALFKNRKRLFNVTFILAVVSAIWMFLLYRLHFATPGADPSRLYYGTDTRMFSILLGAALAFIWPSGKLNANAKVPERILLNSAGTVALAGMLAMVFTLDSQNGWLYSGGMFLFSLLATVLVAVIVHPAGFYNRLLSNPLFHWVGSRSYGIYLYQFPVMIFFEQRFTDVADHPVLYPVIEVAIILVLSELSFRYIEQPIAHFDFHQLRSFFSTLVHPRRHFGRTQVVSYIALLILLIGTAGIAQAPTAKTTSTDTPLAEHLKRNQVNSKQREAELAKQKASIRSARKLAKNRSASLSVSASVSKEAEAKAEQHPVNKDLEQYGLTQVQLQRAQQIGLTAIGDSVMLDGKPLIQRIFPHAFVDAAVSRQMAATIAVVRSYAQAGELADNVVIGLGTNGPFTRGQLRQMMHAIGPQHHVFWINVRVPTRPWQNDVNGLLQGAAHHYHNLSVIDWYDFANPHPEWFYGDQVHPNTLGNPHYAAFVAKAIIEVNE